MLMNEMLSDTQWEFGRGDDTDAMCRDDVTSSRASAGVTRRSLVALLTGLVIESCTAAPPASLLNPGDVAEIGRVEAYLNGLHAASARFLEIWPNGAVSRGTLWLARPGRLRMQYDPPDPILLVASGDRVVYQDMARHSTSSMPLSSTPLAMLLSDPIQFSGDVTVTNVSRLPGQIRVSMVQSERPGTGTLTLILTDSPLHLVGVDLLDSSDRSTQFRLTDLRANGVIDNRMFTIEAPLEPMLSSEDGEG